LLLIWLEPVYTAIRLLFYLENPFVSHNVVVRRTWAQGPGLIGHQGIVLTAHGCNQLGFGGGLFDVEG
jgi:hypothetical protein